MRLINVKTRKLELFADTVSTPYAILSHTWGDDEVSFEDMEKKPAGATLKKGYHKIEMMCRLASDMGIDYAWIDTCCIDKSSSAELSEAINSMFVWYSKAVVCFVFLFDLPAGDAALDSSFDDFKKCRWLSRGWTLQELIAPSNLVFLDSTWTSRGTKREYTAQIETVTGVDQTVLLDAAALSTIPLARRMSWAATRETTRTEDSAYCLMGLFDVNMPMMYGEGRKSFIRLQEEILKKSSDLSLFAWEAGQPTPSGTRGLLARSPAEFRRCGNIIQNNNQFRFREEIASTNKGIRTKIALHFRGNELYVMDLDCYRVTEDGARERIGIWLMRKFDTHLRKFPERITTAEVSPSSLQTSIFLVSDTDDNHQNSNPTTEESVIPWYKDRRIYILLPKRSEQLQYTLIDTRGVPSAFWHSDDCFFSLGELTTFIGFVRFTVATGPGITGRFILVCELLEGSKMLSTTLYAEYGFDISTKPPEFIDPFGDIERYGSVGDPFSLAVLSPGSINDNELVLEFPNNPIRMCANTFLEDEKNPGVFHVLLGVEPIRPRLVAQIGNPRAAQGPGNPQRERSPAKEPITLGVAGLERKNKSRWGNGLFRRRSPSRSNG